MSDINRVSHQARWQYIPLAAPKLEWWERVLRWLDALFEPMLMPEGRKRISPDEPYGCWARGWQRPAMPIK